jgi:hypothetical protein
MLEIFDLIMSLEEPVIAVKNSKLTIATKNLEEQSLKNGRQLEAVSHPPLFHPLPLGNS